MKHRKSLRLWAILLAAVLLPAILPVRPASAAGSGTAVIGQFYEFDAKCPYVTAQGSSVDRPERCGVCAVTGADSVSAGPGNIPVFTTTGSLQIRYTSPAWPEDEDQWHLAEDQCTTVDGVSLENSVGLGAAVVQASRDRKNWHTVYSAVNVLSTRMQAEPLYTSRELELINGCYYRVTVACRLSRNVLVKVFFGQKKKSVEEKRISEVFEFYGCTPEAAQTLPDSAPTYNLGTAVPVGSEGYVGELPMKDDDPHYGITLGRFFVSGYTEARSAADGTPVFLKNVGERVTLWFRLNEDIQAVGGNPAVSVTAGEGYDQYFQTPPMDMGRGTLIMRYTDYRNVSTDPIIYTDYLAANASADANTRVNLFEEGDYEVALDYQLKQKRHWNPTCYRIFFRFSVRNGNCMVYPFDLVTGSELTNSAMTENGFRLDLARSRYLKINVKREMLTDSADGLVEDVRFNGPARDGAEYRTEGIYTITVNNEYTGAMTVKKIYVGTNPVMRAYMTTGLSIPEIRELVDQGAEIDSDGRIWMPQPTEPETTEPAPTAPEPTQPEPTEPELPAETPGSESDLLGWIPERFRLAAVVGAAAVILWICAWLVRRRKKAKAAKEDAGR